MTDEKAKNDSGQGKGKQKVQALRVHAKPKAGFRRAGFEFGYAEPRDLLLSDLKKEQIKALREERNLVVEDVTIEA